MHTTAIGTWAISGEGMTGNINRHKPSLSILKVAVTVTGLRYPGMVEYLAHTDRESIKVSGFLG